MFYTNRLNYRQRNDRPKAFWGALIPAAINFVGGLISSSSQARAQKKALEEQQRLAQQQLAVSNQNNLAATLNNYAAAEQTYDTNDYNLKYRNGGTRRLGSNGIVITDGGNARKIGNNTYLLRGGSHEDINETGQTGIGINVGGNQIEAEGGEVAQKKNGSLRIFSAQPILSNGMSPAQAILRGYNKDKVFAAQQRFKKNNHLNDDGSKARQGTVIPLKRVHIDANGNMIDTLNGKSYTASATNGEDVVVTGKANHWKEAGKKDTSSYFDPMGAVTFASAAGAPILNFTPSNIVGSIREGKDYNSFMNSFMNNNNGGFFTKDYAEKHPYVSFLGNMLGDAAVGGLNNKGIDLIRGRMNYAPYRKLTYKANRLAKKTGLWRPDANRYINDFFDSYVNKGKDEYADALLKRFPDKYIMRLGSGADLENLKAYYSTFSPNNEDLEIVAKNALMNKGSKKDVERLVKIFKDNPEYLQYIDAKVDDNYSKGYYSPLSQESVDDFLKLQGSSIRGVHADNLDEAKQYLAETQKGRFMPGADRLGSNGGLYTSNSPDIADRFKNPEVGKSNGYVGDLQFDFNVDRTKPIEDQLYDARSQIYFDPTISNSVHYYHPFKHNIKAQEIVRQNPRIRAIEADYGRSTGQFLPSTERVYLPSKKAEFHEVETPVTLNNVDEYIGSENKRGRWGAGIPSSKFFIGQTPNATTDFIRDARILLSKVPNRGALIYKANKEGTHRSLRYSKANKLRSRTIYNGYNNYPYKLGDYLYNTAHKRAKKYLDNIRFDEFYRIISPKKYKDFKHENSYMDPFKFGGNIRSKSRLGARYKLRNGGKAKWGTNDYVEAAKTIGSYLPVIGTIEDGYELYKHPSWENAAWFGLGLAGDIFGGRSAIKGIKSLKNINKMRAVSNTIPRLSTRLAVQRQLQNNSKQAIRNISKETQSIGDQMLQDRFKNKLGSKVYYKPNYYHWMHQTSDNLKVNPIDNSYDYRAYYDSATPWELANTMYNADNGHFTDIGKRPSHPTFSNESKYSNSKTPGGNWDDNVFVPSIWQFGNNGNKIRNRYMNNTGEGYFNGRRNVFPRSKHGLGGSVRKHAELGTNIGINSYNTNIPDYNSTYINWLISQLSSENYNQEDIDNAVNAANLAYQNYLIRQLPSSKSNKQDDNKPVRYITDDKLKRNTQSLVDASRRNIDFANNTYRSKLISQLQPKDRRSLKDKTQSIVDNAKFSVYNTINYRNSKLISQLPNKQNTQQKKTNTQQKKTNTPQYKGNVTKGNYQLHDGESKTINGIKYTRIGNTIINHKTNVGYIYDKNGNYTGQADYSKVGKNFNDAFDAARAAGRSQFIYRAGKYNNYSTAKEEDAKKEALNRRIGLRRIAKKCGGIATPRRRYENGGITNLNGTTVYGRNKFNTYAWDNYMRNKALGFMNNMSIPNTPYQQSSYTPQVQSYLNLMSTPFTGRQSSFKPATQDYIGLGIDTLAALGSGLFTRSAYNKLNFNYNLPSYVDETPVAFDTTYHNEAQRANVERNRINGRNLIQGNTASAQTALSRMQEGDTNAMMELNKLADEKANKEVELRNQNAANEQQVRARNAAARNQYYQNVAQIQNAALEAKNNAALAKAQSIGTDLSGLAQAWSNFATSVENRYDSRQNQITMVASANNPAVTQTALRMGYDFSPETLAGLYNTTNDESIRRLILSKMNTRDRIRYGIK